MAVVGVHDGLRVSIVVDGVELHEYDPVAEPGGDDDLDKDKGEQTEKAVPVTMHHRAVTTTKYVKVVSGQKFTISLHIEAPFVMDSDFLGFEVLVDGKRQSSPLLAKSVYTQHGGWSKVIEGVYKRVAGNVVLRSMEFAELETTSESEHVLKAVLEEQAKSLTQVGEIIVIVSSRNRVALSAPAMLLGAVPSSGDSTGQNLAGMTKYHTKLLVKGAQSHSMVLGEKIAVDNSKLMKIETELVGSPELFLAKFRFKYRSRDQLKSLLVIERGPSPKSAQAEIQAEAQVEAEAAVPPSPAQQTPTPPPSPTEAQRRLAELKEDLKKKQDEINRHMRECSIKAEDQDDTASIGTIKAEPVTPSIEADVKQENVPAASQGIKREREDDDESANAATRVTKKQKPKYKVTTIIDLTDDKEAVELE